MKAIYTVEVRKNNLLIDSKRDLELGALKSYVLANYDVLDEIYTFRFYQDLSLLDLDIRAEVISAAEAETPMAEDVNSETEALTVDTAEADNIAEAADEVNTETNIEFKSLFS